MNTHLCRFLRWKGYYGASFPSEDALAEAFVSADAAFSCLQTTHPWGPDQNLCAPERCTPSRSCFVRSPKAPPTLQT